MRIRYSRVKYILERLDDATAFEIFDRWRNLGERNFLVNSEMYQVRDMGVFEALFKQFESTEDYEICSELQEMHWRILGID